MIGETELEMEIPYKSMTTLSNRNVTLVAEGPNYCGYRTPSPFNILGHTELADIDVD